MKQRCKDCIYAQGDIRLVCKCKESDENSNYVDVNMNCKWYESKKLEDD